MTPRYETHPVLLSEARTALFGDAELSHWPRISVVEIARTTSGGTPSRADPSNFGGGIPWVKSGEVAQGTIEVTEETITPRALATSSAKLMPKGTIVIAMYGATAGEVGVLGIEAATNQAVCCITAGPGVDSRFLEGALRAQKRTLKSQAVGGAQPNLSQTHIRATRLPFPPLDEQRAIADRDEAIESAQRQLRSQAVELDALFASLQHRAFRGEL